MIKEGGVTRVYNFKKDTLDRVLKHIIDGEKIQKESISIINTKGIEVKFDKFVSKGLILGIVPIDEISEKYYISTRMNELVFCKDSILQKSCFSIISDTDIIDTDTLCRSINKEIKNKQLDDFYEEVKLKINTFNYLELHELLLYKLKLNERDTKTLDMYLNMN